MQAARSRRGDCLVPLAWGATLDVIGGRLLVLDKVADELGCSVATVKRRVRSGELPVYVDGRIVRVREDDLRRYIAEHIQRRVASVTSSMPAGRRIDKGLRLWD